MPETKFNTTISTIMRWDAHLMCSDFVSKKKKVIQSNSNVPQHQNMKNPIVLILAQFAKQRSAEVFSKGIFLI